MFDAQIKTMLFICISRVYFVSRHFIPKPITHTWLFWHTIKTLIPYSILSRFKFHPFHNMMLSTLDEWSETILTFKLCKTFNNNNIGLTVFMFFHRIRVSNQSIIRFKFQSYNSHQLDCFGKYESRNEYRWLFTKLFTSISRQIEPIVSNHWPDSVQSFK